MKGPLNLGCRWLKSKHPVTLEVGINVAHAPTTMLPKESVYASLPYLPKSLSMHHSSVYGAQNIRFLSFTVARQVKKLVLDPFLLFISCDPLEVGFSRGSIGVEERSMGLAPPPRAIYSGGGFGSRGVLRAWSIRTSRLL